MRIAFVSMFYKPTIGGVEKVIEKLATRYVKQGHIVDIFCCDGDKYGRIKNKYEVIDGVNVHRARYWLRLSLNTHIFPGVVWMLLRYKFDIVHSHVGAHDYVLFTGLIAKLKRKPHIHTTHCPWTDKFRPFILRLVLFFTDNFFNYISFNLCNKIIAITPWEVPILKKWVKEDKIKVLHNGMDANLFEKVKNNSFRKEIMVNPENKLVLFFGRLNPTKAPDHFARVARMILEERNDIEFAIVGPDEGLMNEVKKIVNNHPMIHVTGPWPHEKINQMYQASDLYVLTSYREGLPLTLFEAMASGLPIIATPCNGVPYEIEDGVNGYLVKYGDFAEQKRRILEVLDNPFLYKKFSKNNIEKVKGYTWDEIANETMRIYNQEIQNYGKF